MPDLGHKLTEEELAALEKRIHSMYSEASEELTELIVDYFDKFKIRDEAQKKLLEAGEITEEQYKQWRLAQIGRGKRFEALRDELAERMYKANAVAAAYINDATPGIYSLNRNYTAYTIEQVHGNVGFTLLDEQTVRRLLVEEPNLMPHYPEKRAIRRGIDLSFSKQQITASVTSGILQGKSVGKIATDLQERIDGMERASAIRAARTAVTAAQNAGRQDSYVRAAELGIKLRKRWIATKDLVTRHSHAMLDGQTVEYDEPFTSVLGSKLMFPGDGAGKAADVYNCRCTMRTVEKEGIEAEPRQMRVRNPVTGRNELVNEMTYNEWYEWKRSQDPGAFDAEKKKIKNEASDKRQFAEYKSALGKNAPKTFEEFQKLKYNSGEWEQFKDYSKAIKTGELTALANFELYKSVSKEIDEVLVGLTTSNGIVITGKSKHFVSRVIGSLEQKRSGVNVDDVLRTLTDEKAKVFPVKESASGDRSQKFRGGSVEVSVNPDTGNLIQVNPYT